MDPRIIKPKVDSHGNPVDPAELPLLRMYQRYTRFIRHGRSEKEAAELALRPRGVCDRKLPSGEKCGLAAKTSGGCVCAEHARQELVLRARAFRAKQCHLVEKVCQVPGCGKAFVGHHERKNCDEHTQQRMQKRSDAGKPRKASRPVRRPRTQLAPAEIKVVAPAPGGGRASYRNPNLPDTWDRPLPEHLRELPKPAPVVVPPGFKVKFIPMPNWGRSEGGDA